MQKKKVIINADDLGRSPEINSAILKSFEGGWVSDVSIMTTCKRGIEDLVLRMEDGQLSQLAGIGCHLCLTLGEPLCSETILSRYVNNGEFKDVFEIPHNYFFRKNERKLIYNEFRAQVIFLKKNLKMPISHLDSHQHIHFGLGILPLVVRLCKEENIPYLRIPNYSKELSWKSKVATKLKIIYIKVHGIKTVDIFGSPQQVLTSMNSDTDIMEVMVHPMFNSKGVIVNKVRINDVNQCEQLSGQIEQFANCQKTSYSKLLEFNI